MTPEARARVEIDRLPKAAGRYACKHMAVNARMAGSTAIRKSARVKECGHAHYLLKVCRKGNKATHRWPR